MKTKAFRGPDAAEKYQRAGKWLLAVIYGNEKALAWCKEKGIAVRKQQGETVDQYGGYLVHQELAAAIFDIRDSYGAFRRRARLLPMKSDNTVIPRYTGGITGYIVGENTAFSTQTDDVGAVELTTKKIGALIQLSSEIDEDSLPDIIDFLANEAGWALAVKEDQCAFAGTGTSTYGGMNGIANIVLDGNHAQAKVTAASGHNTYLGLTATDLANTMAAVRASAIPRAAWFISQLGFAQTICRIAGTSNGFIEMREVDGILTPCYLGFPVILTQALPQVSSSLSGNVMLAFGDMYAGGVLGQRKGLAIAVSPERYVDTDQIGVRIIERVHCVIDDIGDNTNMGSLAALVGN